MARRAGGGDGGGGSGGGGAGARGDEEDTTDIDDEGLSMNEISQFLQDLERLNETKEQVGGRFGPGGKLKRSYRSRMQRDGSSSADEASATNGLEDEIMRIFGDDDTSADDEELGTAAPGSPGNRKTRGRSRGAKASAKASLLDDVMGRQPRRRSGGLANTHPGDPLEGALADLSGNAGGGSARRWEPSLQPKEPPPTPEHERENRLERQGVGGGWEDDTEEDEREDGDVSPRSTRELFEEAMEALTPELRDMWVELSKLAGNSKAVALLQDIVRSTPDGMVQPELFQALFPFDLDQFQTQALRGLSRRKNVIVSAPTGSGKTVVGELAVYYALALNLRVFYTTPLKALSNQKFADFRRQFGSDKVGLLTGDNNYNRDAQVAVMTTEVFRNMLYDTEEAENGLSDVFAVVFDEFHYMNDRDRGTVWEESVINCPKEVLLVALSATMSNVGEIRDWIQHTHGPSSLVVSDFRPVPLTYWFATSDGLFHLFQDADSGPGARNGGHKPGDAVPEEVNIGPGDGFAKPLTRRERRRRIQPPARLRINPELLRSHEEEMSSVRRYLEDEESRYGGGDRSRGRGSRQVRLGGRNRIPGNGSIAIQSNLQIKASPEQMKATTKDFYNLLNVEGIADNLVFCGDAEAGRGDGMEQ